MNLTDTYRRLQQLRLDLGDHEAAAAARSKQLRQDITDVQTTVFRVQAGLEPELIALGASLLEIRGTFARAGEGRASARQDAIDALALVGGEPLRHRYIGTKNYAHRSGQRSDHEYNMGPKHGTIIFSIGLKYEARTREPFALTDREIEACVYYLTHLEAIEQSLTAAQAA